MNEYNVGDKLVCNDCLSFHRIVIAVVKQESTNKTLIVTEDSDDLRVILLRTDAMNGWHKEPAVTELTLQEVAAKFNIPADKLRIKE